MFRLKLSPEEGLLMVEPYASRLNTAIHMFFMFFPIATIWLDDNFCVVDMVLARPWFVYVPRKPARYTLETHPSLLENIQIGERLSYEV
jgi:hypothetical protein